ncbi:VacB/RNase II family 3'-5' exoribonuclease [Leptolyngbya sp. FACHB-261]|nr:VacB/RNase II family 3'-5' exoribonuclease [Leptolyngbya sp. FACHB-261]
MDFSISELLESFSDSKLVAPKVLEKRFGEDQSSIRKLQIVLDTLEKVGILEKEKGRYRRVTDDDVIEGRLRCSSKGFCFAIQDGEEVEDVYVRESHLSNAWNGDRVLVRVTKEGKGRRSPEGEVRLILERANSSLLARVKKTDQGYRAIPLDDRLPCEIELLDEGTPLPEGLADNSDQLVHIEVMRYPLGAYLPVGRIARVLGRDPQVAPDIELVCCKYELPREFSETVLEAAADLPDQPYKADLKGRVDLRKLFTLTIARPDAKAFEDAISLEVLEDGKWRLGVHIADVAYYVPLNSTLDLEARRRATSVFLGETVLPLLPEALSHHLCSLLPGENRLAISVLLTLDAAGEVLEYELQPSIITVDLSLTDQQVQQILEDRTDESVQAFAPAFELLDAMLRLSLLLKANRQERGALELSLPDAKFHYNDEGELGALVVSPSLRAQSIVKEFMLLANETVAEHLQALDLPGIYRIHPASDLSSAQELLKLLTNMGLELSLEQEDVVTSRDYQAFIHKFADSDVQTVLTYLLLGTLKPPAYSTEPGTHFGLALSEGYSHFTSPLRRYADLVVQRVLQALFDEGRDRRSTRVKERVKLRHSSVLDSDVNWNVLPPDIQKEIETDLEAIVTHLNERERLAQKAEQDLEALRKAEFMRARTGEIFRGLITGVQSYGFFVEIEDLLVEGLVHVSSLKDDWYEYRSRHQTLVGRKNRKQYRLGDRVEVQVKNVDYYRQQIDLVAVGGGSQAADDDNEEAPTDTTQRATSEEE